MMLTIDNTVATKENHRMAEISDRRGSMVYRTYRNFNLFGNTFAYRRKKQHRDKQSRKHTWALQPYCMAKELNNKASTGIQCREELL